MVIVLTALFVISAILLAAMVLIQDDQGEGIGGMFGGGSTSAFGSRSGNVLTKATAVLAAVFLLSAAGVAWLNKSSATDDIEARARVRQLEQGGSGGWYAPSTTQADSVPADTTGGVTTSDADKTESKPTNAD